MTPPGFHRCQSYQRTKAKAPKRSLAANDETRYLLLSTDRTFIE